MPSVSIRGATIKSPSLVEPYSSIFREASNPPPLFICAIYLYVTQHILNFYGDGGWFRSGTESQPINDDGIPAGPCNLPGFHRGYGKFDHGHESNRLARRGFDNSTSCASFPEVASRGIVVTAQAGQLRILVVDGELAILRFLRASLKGQGYIVSTATDARTAIDLVHRDTTDLVVLDLGLIDGLNVIRQIRNGGGTLPIIVLSSCDSESFKVSALDLGADDYVTKPFGTKELLARIRTAQRHRLAQRGEKSLFQAGDLCVDLVGRVVLVRNEKVQFSPREYEVLRLLVAHAGRVLTHDFILREIWGSDANARHLRIYIRALRQKIEVDPERPAHILTVTRVGYRLRDSD